MLYALYSTGDFQTIRKLTRFFSVCYKSTVPNHTLHWVVKCSPLKDCDQLITSFMRDKSLMHGWNSLDDIVWPPYSNETPLVLAVQNGRVSVARMLLEKGAAPNKCQPLRWAALLGNQALVELLLRQPTIDVNAANEEGITPLHSACCQPNSRIVELLLDAKADPNGGRTGSVSPIDCAAYYGWAQSVALLLEHNATVTPEETTTLHSAVGTDGDRFGRKSVVLPQHHDWKDVTQLCEKGDRVSILKRLIEREEIEIDAVDGDGRTALDNAVQNRYVQAAHFLLDQGACVRSKTLFSLWPLCWKPADSDTLALIRRIASDERMRSFLNSKHPAEESTPLEHACEYHRPEVVELFLSLGADLNIGYPLHCLLTTPFERLKPEDPGDILRTLMLILENKPVDFNVNKVWSGKETALHRAVGSRLHEVVALLLQHGGDPTLANHDGQNPLHRAGVLSLSSKDPSEEKVAALAVMRSLLTHKDCALFIDARDKKGCTPLHVACERVFPQGAQLLLQKGADPALMDCEGRNALHFACGRMEQVEPVWEEKEKAAGLAVIRRLLDHEKAAALINARDNRGQTPLDYARQVGFPEAVQLLVEAGEQSTSGDSESFTEEELALLASLELVGNAASADSIINN